MSDSEYDMGNSEPQLFICVYNLFISGESHLNFYINIFLIFESNK